jgi:recombination protein RecT
MTTQTETGLTAYQQRQEELAKNAWGLIQQQKRNIAAVLPKHITPDRLAMIAFTAMRRTPKLLECSRESIVGSLLTAAMLGLEPSGPLGHGALIPYKGECQFQPMYQGLLDLARRSGFIRDVQLRPVYQGDTYHYKFGLEPDITHVPMEGPGADDPDRKVTHVYCIIRFMNGGVQWDQMSYEQGLAHGMRYSPSWDRLKKEFKPGSVWADNPVAMILKTICKRVLKLCPKSPEMAAALTLDDHQEAGRLARLSMAEPGMLDVMVEDAPAADDGRERGALDITAFKPGNEANRGHGEESLDQVAKDKQDPRKDAAPQWLDKPADTKLEKQLDASVAALACDVQDFVDIETALKGSGIPLSEVTDHVRNTMGFPRYEDLTKGRKGEVLAWIQAKRRK